MQTNSDVFFLGSSFIKEDQSIQASKPRRNEKGMAVL